MPCAFLFVNSPCRSLDSRSPDPPDLLRIFWEDRERPLLVKSRRALSVEGLQSIPLVVGPAAFYYLLHVQEFEPGALQELEICGHHESMLNSYKPIIVSAFAGKADCLEAARRYTEAVLEQQHYEETLLYPQVDAFLGDGRFTRELRYEHQGVSSGLATLPALLQSCLVGSATRRQIEKQELDLLHLLEHHIERETRGLYPLLLLLKKIPKRA